LILSTIIPHPASAAVFGTVHIPLHSPPLPPSICPCSSPGPSLKRVRHFSQLFIHPFTHPSTPPPHTHTSCQVILIHLSNLTGLADDYNKRTMALLVSDIGTIMMGVTAAIASGYVKVRRGGGVVFICVSVCQQGHGMDG